MSYILDALNKSEQERREQDNVPNLQAIHDGKRNGHSSGNGFPWVPVVVAVILVVLLFLVVVLSLSRNDDATPEVVAPQSQALRQTTSAQAPPVRKTLVPTSLSGRGLNNNSFAQSNLPNVQSANAAVNSLYAQENDTNTHTSNSASNSTQTNKTQTSAEVILNSVDARLADAVAAEYRASERAVNNVPNVEQLPRHLQFTVPALDYSAHIYSSDERSGFAIINGRSRYKGDILSKNLFVEAVEEDGVVLNVQGVSFKVSAMKSWQPPK